jgi:hypothetical protein
MLEWLDLAKSNVLINDGGNGIVSMAALDSSNAVQNLPLTPPVVLALPSTFCNKTTIISEIANQYSTSLEGLRRVNGLKSIGI